MKVKIRENRRYYESEEADFNIKATEIKELYEKQLKSYSIKDQLLSGILMLVEGQAILQIKHAKVFFNSETPDLCYGIEFGKFFSKRLDTNQIFWHADDEVPKDVYEILTEGKISVEKDAEEEKEDDISETNDGLSEESKFFCEKEGCEIEESHDHNVMSKEDNNIDNEIAEEAEEKTEDTI